MDRLRAKNSIPHLYRAVAALILLAVVGVAGFRVLEGYSLVDSLYMTVITISTVGFGEVRPLSPAGRLFTVGLILGGVGIAAYTLTAAVEYVVSGQWRAQWTKRRERRMRNALNRHVIVCGFGRVGRFVAQDLAAESVPFVIIEKDPERMELTRRFGYLALQGNAANESLLEQAGIRRARGLVAALDSDAENVYIALTARGLNPALYIIARANFEESESKLLRAGADRVLLPYAMSGRRMVTMLLRPEVADFLDEVVFAGGEELLLEQVRLQPGSALSGKTLAEARGALQADVTVVAYKNPGETKNLRPAPGLRLADGMQLLALGTRDDLRRLTQIAAGTARFPATPPRPSRKQK